MPILLSVLPKALSRLVTITEMAIIVQPWNGVLIPVSVVPWSLLPSAAWLIVHLRVSHCSNPRHNTKCTVVDPTLPLFPAAPYHALFPHISFNRQHRSAGSALQIRNPFQLSRMFFDIGVQTCGFEGLSKQDNGLHSVHNKMYALVIQKAAHCAQYRLVSQIPFELYPRLDPHKPSLRWLRG